MGAVLCAAREVPAEAWLNPKRIVIDAGIPREPLLSLAKGHFWMDGQRHMLMSTGGPLRWPLHEDGKVQDSVVWDPSGPPGTVRLLSAKAVPRPPLGKPMGRPAT